MGVARIGGQAVKDKIYKDWQEGMTQAEISAKYNITLHAIKKILNQTPRERTCPVCKTVFVAHKGGRYCSFECCQYYHKRLKNKPSKKKRTTLDDYLKTINIADYAELQKAETLNMIAR
jgi:hypothetical protein